MITKDELLPLFLEACPSLRPAFDQRQADWVGDGGPYPSIELSQFANQFVELKRQQQTQELDAGFALLERLYVEGDASVQETVTMCFLEDFVAQAESLRLDPQAFVPHLRPVSREHWEDMRRWWASLAPTVPTDTGTA